MRECSAGKVSPSFPHFPSSSSSHHWLRGKLSSVTVSGTPGLRLGVNFSFLLQLIKWNLSCRQRTKKERWRGVHGGGGKFAVLIYAASSFLASCCACQSADNQQTIPTMIIKCIATQRNAAPKWAKNPGDLSNSRPVNQIKRKKWGYISRDSLNIKK